MFWEEDNKRSFVPGKARTILSIYDDRAQHYDIIKLYNIRNSQPGYFTYC